VADLTGDLLITNSHQGGELGWSALLYTVQIFNKIWHFM
jgi:hypothetical protein